MEKDSGIAARFPPGNRKEGAPSFTCVTDASKNHCKNEQEGKISDTVKSRKKEET